MENDGKLDGGMDKGTLKRRNIRTGITTIVVAAGMMVFAFAAAPLYSIVCAKLGWEGTPKRAVEASTNVVDIPITVRFDANIDKALPWKFAPVEKSVRVKLGETKTVFYRATNTSDQAMVGTATFNVTPEKIGQYYNKVACFCFQEQVLQPGQTAELGVTFFVDPAMAQNATTEEVRTITLSYTFFKSADGLPQTDSAAAEASVKLTAEPLKTAAKVN